MGFIQFCIFAFNEEWWRYLSVVMLQTEELFWDRKAIKDCTWNATEISTGVSRRACCLHSHVFSQVNKALMSHWYVGWDENAKPHMIELQHLQIELGSSCQIDFRRTHLWAHRWWKLFTVTDWSDSQTLSAWQLLEAIA